jgi:hypothetical protein
LSIDIKVPQDTGVTLRDGRIAITDATKPSVRDLSPEQLKSILESSRTAERTRIASHRLGRFGIQGSDGNFHSHDDVVSLLLQGKDPSMEAAGSIPAAKSLRISDVDLSKPNSIVIGDQPEPGRLPTEETADARSRRQPGDRTGKPKPPGDGDNTVKPPVDSTAAPTDLTRAPKETDKVTVLRPRLSRPA